MKLKDRIALNRNSKVGDKLICPVCKSEFVKKSYQHVYCSLQCKDKRHNQINSDRHRDPFYYEKRYNYYFPRHYDVGDEAMEMTTDNDYGTYYGDQD